MRGWGCHQEKIQSGKELLGENRGVVGARTQPQKVFEKGEAGLQKGQYSSGATATLPATVGCCHPHSGGQVDEKMVGWQGPSGFNEEVEAGEDGGGGGEYVAHAAVRDAAVATLTSWGGRGDSMGN